MKIGGRISWKWAVAINVAVFLAAFVGRWVSGLPLFGGTGTTDATFTRTAQRVRAGWWANLPIGFRAALRLAPFGMLWGWATEPTWTVVAGVGCVGLLSWGVVRQWQAWRYERRVLRPLWPAVASIIGVDPDESPRAWLDVPEDMSADDAEIAVGLREDDTDNDRRLLALVRFFDQWRGGAYVGRVDHVRRLVLIRARPGEPAIWPAVARALRIDPGELAEKWLTLPAAPGADDAVVRVELPGDLVDDGPVTLDLRTLVAQRFGGEWTKHVNREARYVELRRKQPSPVPPTVVDFLTEHPDYQEVTS